MDAKGIGRRILDRVHETYGVELAGKKFAYDGEKSLFTVGPLPQNKLEFTVILDDVSSNRYMIPVNVVSLNSIQSHLSKFSGSM